MDPLIISTADMATLEKTTPRARRVNQAFGRGGSYDLVTLQGWPVLGVVPDPDKLTPEQAAEITESVTKERARIAAVLGEPAPIPSSTPVPTPPAPPAPAPVNAPVS